MIFFRASVRVVVLILLALVGVSLADSEAYAQSSEGYVAVGLEFESSDMEQGLVNDLEKATVAAFEGAEGWDFVGFARARAELESEQKGCYSEECLIEIGEKFAAKRALSVEVSGAAEVYKWTFKIWDLEDGARIDTQVGACELCGKAELGEAFEQSVRGAAQTLISGEAAGSEEEGQVLLHITALPEDAEIIINDEPVGAGEVTLPVLPGAYDVHVHKEGYRDMIERVIVSREGGGPVVLRVYLTPSDPALVAPTEGPIDRLGSTRTTLGLVGVGVGIASLGVGIYLTAIDGNPACDDNTPSSACPDVYATAGGGLAMGVLGTALITGGAGLLSWELLRGRSGEEEQIEAAETDEEGEAARLNRGSTLSLNPAASGDGAGLFLRGAF